MKPEDSVKLVVMFIANNLIIPSTRLRAEEMLKMWIDFSQSGDEKLEVTLFDEFKSRFGIRLRHVVAMSIEEYENRGPSATEKLAEAQLRVASAIEKQVNEGEQWRSDE